MLGARVRVPLCNLVQDNITTEGRVSDSGKRERERGKEWETSSEGHINREGRRKREMEEEGENYR